MKEFVLSDDEILEGDLNDEDITYIDEVMSDGVKEAEELIDKEVEADEQLSKELDEMLDTDDIQKRVEIWKKYHPEDNRFM